MKKPCLITKAALLLAIAFTSLNALAGKPVYEDGSNMGTENFEHYLHPWLWLVGAVIIILMIVAFFQDDGYKSGKKKVGDMKFNGH